MPLPRHARSHRATIRLDGASHEAASSWGSELALRSPPHPTGGPPRGGSARDRRRPPAAVAQLSARRLSSPPPPGPILTGGSIIDIDPARIRWLSPPDADLAD